MRLRFLLFASLLLPALARAGELRTLTGEAVKGEPVRVTDTEVVFRADDRTVKTPLDQVLTIDLASVPPEKEAAKYTEVELTDGSILRCDPAGVSLVGTKVRLKLITGQELEIPLAAVTSILHDAGNPALRQEWDKLFAGKKRNRDVLVVKAKEGTKLNPLEGTFGDADDKGEKIAFELSSGKTSVPLTRIHGLYFQRGVDAGAAPVICKLFDTGRNVVFATSVTLDETAYTVATPAGVKIVFSRPAVARLDFSKGKLTFLSDVPPSKLKVTLKGVTGEVVDPLHPSKDLDTIDPVCRDRNLDGRPLRLGGTAYPKGLAIHAGTELVFDLAGEYREFKAMVGVDDSVLGWSAETAVHVEADGKELANLTVSRKEKPKPLTLNVKDVQKLRIVVSSTNVLQYGRHAELADAKVTK